MNSTIKTIIMFTNVPSDITDKLQNMVEIATHFQMVLKLITIHSEIISKISNKFQLKPFNLITYKCYFVEQT